MVGESQTTRTVVATFESCTVYAGATDYYFKSEAGKLHSFRNSNMEGEAPKVQLPVSLMAAAEDSEGPPGANPEWVGKTFELSVDSNDQVVALAVHSSSEEKKRPTKVTDSEPDSPVIFLLPKGFSSEFNGGHEGSAVVIKNVQLGQVHIFTPSSGVYGEAEVTGENGIITLNKWTLLDKGLASQPQLDWARKAYPFRGEDGTEGVVWTAGEPGRQYVVTASSETGQLDELYQRLSSMLKAMRTRD